jgi:hypothetical protein
MGKKSDARKNMKGKKGKRESIVAEMEIMDSMDGVEKERARVSAPLPCDDLRLPNWHRPKLHLFNLAPLGPEEPKAQTSMCSPP